MDTCYKYLTCEVNFESCRQQLFLQWAGAELHGDQVSDRQPVYLSTLGHPGPPPALLQRTGLPRPETAGQLLPDNKGRRQTLVLHDGQEQALGAL